MRYLSTKEVAVILGAEHPLKPVTVQKMAARGEFPHALRKGRVWLIPERDLTPQLRARYAGGARPVGGRPPKQRGRPRPRPPGRRAEAA